MQCPPPSHMHEGWMVSATKTPTSSAPRRTIFSRCICRCSRMRARLSLPRVLLPHTYTQDGWFLQPKRRPARLPRRTIFSRCILRYSRMNARPPPPTYTPPPHTGFPMSAHLSICGACFGFGSGFGIGFTLLLTLSFTRSSPSRHPQLKGIWRLLGFVSVRTIKGRSSCRPLVRSLFVVPFFIWRKANCLFE